MPVSDPVKSGSAPGISKKNEAGQFNITQPQAQARPCLRILAARPGNLLERCFSVSGTERHFQFIGTEEKNDIRNVLQSHYWLRGLEPYKAYIKTSFEMMYPMAHAACHKAVLIRLSSSKNILSKQITFQGASLSRIAMVNAAVDCPAAVAAPLAVPAAVPPGAVFSRFRGPGPVAGSPPGAFVRVFSSSFPSAVLASASLPRA
jgi:hypothetical protein